MDLAIDISCNCKVRVLLVPVSPIKKPTYLKYVTLLKTFKLVHLGDVTPDLKQGASAMFSSQVFQEGQMHFQFVTSWTREHTELEDFQPHRRIFGVIGIMDCQEWKDKDLSEGYRQFAQSLDKYPTAVATRCFAFDPSESQADDTKGLIMIPNVGNMSFYMSTMICDFASEILTQFGTLAKRIQNLSILESPLPARIHIPARSRPSPQQQHYRYSQPPSLSLSPSSSASDVTKRSSLQPSNQSLNSMSNVTTGESMRTKKRTPGRIRKLLGDFYLLAGRLPDALNHYEQAIEMAKVTSDFLWLASAIEGWVCATLLLECLQADIGHIISRSPIISHPMTRDSNSDDDYISPTPTPTFEGPRSTLSVIVENYAKIISHYARVVLTANFPVPDLVYAESCLKIARVLTTAYLNGGWDEGVMTHIIQGKLGEKNSALSGIPRHDIAEWVTKIWDIRLDELALLDQIYLTTSMSTIYSSIGYHRKAAWLMHESVERMLPLLVQNRRSAASNKNTVATSHDDGVLEILKKICEIYGIGEKNVVNGTLEVMQQQKQEDRQAKRRITQQQFGWPALQIDILKQCISVSDALLDNASRLYYTTVLLKNMYQYISKAEQIKLATTIQGMVVNNNKRTAEKQQAVNYWGVNIVSRLEAKRPISRKVVYAHPIKNDTVAHAAAKKEDANDPFIYNPFAKKVQVLDKVVLVKGEMSEFKVSLVNPFGFDLELQNIILSTSGIAFTAVPTALVIPANATVHIPLMGTPEETGTLIIRGCLIQIIGFAGQEFLVEQDVKKSSEEVSNDHFVKIKLSGLNVVKSNRKGVLSGDMGPINFHELKVIEDQPLLKIKSTSLMHGAVMLYEGEVTHIIMELENIGNIAVDFITLSFTDSTTMNPLPINPELSTEDQYEIELYTKGTRVFSWEGSSDKMSNDLIGKKIWLTQGDSITIKVNVYGKRDCTGGTIQVDYGYLDRTVSKVEEIKAEHKNDEQKIIEEEVKATMFYTRQLYLNVLITVYRNLDPFNWDVVYLRHSAPAPQEVLDQALLNIKNQQQVTNKLINQDQPIEDLLLLTRNIGLEHQERNEYCLVTVDVRNVWNIPFDIDFIINNKVEGEEGSEQDQLKSLITIKPGSTSRIILPVKRLFLSMDVCSQDIPTFDPNKQFVVAQGPKISAEQQKARLQMFWYREEFLSRIKATWHCRSTGRFGIVNLRPSLRLGWMQLNILKKEDVEFLVDVRGDHVQKLSHRRFSCGCNDCIIMTISIRNRFPYPIKVILRLQPVQSYNDGMKEYDLTDKLLLEGVGQAVLPEIPASNGLISHSFPLYFLSRGQFELLYHAEDVHTRKIYYDHEWAVVDVTEKNN